MILAIALIVLLVIVSIVFFQYLVKTKEVETIRQDYEQYKDSTRNELVELRGKNVTFDTLLDQEKQKC